MVFGGRIAIGSKPALSRLEEAATISPGQSSEAEAKERHPGYMLPENHVRPVRTTT